MVEVFKSSPEKGIVSCVWGNQAEHINASLTQHPM